LDNIKQRRLPFSLAEKVLEDFQRIERHDDEHSTPEEDRWQTIGTAEKALRLADTEERRLYDGYRDLYKD
jgi:uncharacterized DUF497 family protein